MNAKKRLTLILLGIIMILPILNTGCFKKGSEDPFVSMYTRKARMTGTWKFAETNSEIRTAIGENDQNVRIVTTTSDNKNWKQVIRILPDSVRTYNGKIDPNENYLTFYKYGNFEKNFVYEYTDDIEENDGEIINRYRYEISEKSRGTWNFLAGIDEKKNKERITMIYDSKFSQERVYLTVITDDDEVTPIERLLRVNNIDETYANGEQSEIWTLVGLKNKEIKMEQPVYNKYTETQIGRDTPTSITESGKHTVLLKR